MLYLTDGLAKCASAEIKNNELFINDILVNYEFKNCNLGKINPFKMIKEFISVAKNNNLRALKLEDDAFLQIPQTYYTSGIAPIKYSVLYLYKNPEKPSIYSSKFNFINDHSSKQWYNNLIQTLKLSVDNYKLSDSYNLYENALRLYKNKKDNNINNITNDSEYQLFLTNYKKFDSYIIDIVNTFMISNINDLILDHDILQILEKNGFRNNTDVINKLTEKHKFHDFIKIIGMDKFNINEIYFDHLLTL
jgi:hypothetical protein